jgi:hypothetical protein
MFRAGVLLEVFLKIWGRDLSPEGCIQGQAGSHDNLVGLGRDRGRAGSLFDRLSWNIGQEKIRFARYVVGSSLVVDDLDGEVV